MWLLRRPLLLLVFLVIAAGIAGVSYLEENGFPVIPLLNPEPSGPQDGLSPETPFVMSAKELNDENRIDPIHFRVTYADKWIRVTGRVSYRDSDGVSLDDLGFAFGTLRGVTREAQDGRKFAAICLMESERVRFMGMTTGRTAWYFNRCRLP